MSVFEGERVVGTLGFQGRRDPHLRFRWRELESRSLTLWRGGSLCCHAMKTFLFWEKETARYGRCTKALFEASLSKTWLKRGLLFSIFAPML